MAMAKCAKVSKGIQGILGKKPNHLNWDEVLLLCQELTHSQKMRCRIELIDEFWARILADDLEPLEGSWPVLVELQMTEIIHEDYHVALIKCFGLGQEILYQSRPVAVPFIMNDGREVLVTREHKKQLIAEGQGLGIKHCPNTAKSFVELGAMPAQDDLVRALIEIECPKLLLARAVLKQTNSGELVNSLLLSRNGLSRLHFYASEYEARFSEPFDIQKLTTAQMLQIIVNDPCKVHVAQLVFDVELV